MEEFFQHTTMPTTKCFSLTLDSANSCMTVFDRHMTHLVVVHQI